MGFPARSTDRNVRSPLILLKRLFAGFSGTHFPAFNFAIRHSKLDIGAGFAPSLPLVENEAGGN